MTFDEWWEKNKEEFLSDSLHMSEYHMASVVWEAAEQNIQFSYSDSDKGKQHDIFTTMPEND